MFFGWFQDRRRRRLMAEPFPTSWREIVTANVAHYRLIKSEQRLRLENVTKVLVAERSWVGCRGQEINDEVKVTIAAQASLLLLGVDGYYFDRVSSFLIYPTRYLHGDTAPRRSMLDMSPPQVVDEEERQILGESWTQGSVVLSWADVVAGGRDPADGHNLVLHELAHHLDALDGEMGGSPPFGSRAEVERWKKVSEAATQRVAGRYERGEPTVLYSYATTSPAEFFAVATEAFFERPQEFAAEFPEVFALLQALYKVDPRPWFAGPRRIRRPAARYEPDEAPEPEPPRESAAQALSPLSSADAYFTRGVEYLDAGEWNWALHDFNQALRRSPDDAETLRYRAEALLAVGREEEAERDARRAVELEPSEREHDVTLGTILVARGFFQEAITVLERRLADDAQDLRARFELASAAAGMRDFERAIAEFSEVIQQDADDAEAYFLRGRCFKELGRRREAEADFQAARRINPKVFD